MTPPGVPRALDPRNDTSGHPGIYPGTDTASLTPGGRLPWPAPRLQRLVDTALPNPASVCDVHFDYAAWNRAYAVLRQDPAQLPADRRNLLWMMFAEAGGRARLRGWEPAAGVPTTAADLQRVAATLAADATGSA